MQLCHTYDLAQTSAKSKEVGNLDLSSFSSQRSTEASRPTRRLHSRGSLRSPLAVFGYVVHRHRRRLRQRRRAASKHRSASLGSAVRTRELRIVSARPQLSRSPGAAALTSLTMRCPNGPQREHLPAAPSSFSAHSLRTLAAPASLLRRPAGAWSASRAASGSSARLRSAGCAAAAAPPPMPSAAGPPSERRSARLSRSRPT